MGGGQLAQHFAIAYAITQLLRLLLEGIIYVLYTGHKCWYWVFYGCIVLMLLIWVMSLVFPLAFLTVSSNHMNNVIFLSIPVLLWNCTVAAYALSKMRRHRYQRIYNENIMPVEARNQSQTFDFDKLDNMDQSTFGPL